MLVSKSMLSSCFKPGTRVYFIYLISCNILRYVYFLSPFTMKNRFDQRKVYMQKMCKLDCVFNLFSFVQSDACTTCNTRQISQVCARFEIWSMKYMYLTIFFFCMCRGSSRRICAVQGFVPAHLRGVWLQWNVRWKDEPTKIVRYHRSVLVSKSGQ